MTTENDVYLTDFLRKLIADIESGRILITDFSLTDEVEFDRRTGLHRSGQVSWTVMKR
jgi:hypothetical protein